MGSGYGRSNDYSVIGTAFYVMEGNRLLIPQMTVKEGMIVYRQVDFM